MFLSKLVLNLRNPQVRIDLARPYEMHRTLWRAFPKGEPGRVLFRVDSHRRGGSPTMLVQSEHDPIWGELPSNYFLRPAESKRLELNVVTGQRLRFRLRANPTKRVASKNERLGSVIAGKRVGLATEREQIAWLLRKGQDGGFSIPGEWVEEKHTETCQLIPLPNFRVDVTSEGRDRNGKPGYDGEFIAVRFEGILKVTDSEKFRETVFAGIGSGKSFGFGLLSLAPA
jgi:CRISPR system Cascade subunit CasE